jgi:hypothetical protein
MKILRKGYFTALGYYMNITLWLKTNWIYVFASSWFIDTRGKPEERRKDYKTTTLTLPTVTYLFLKELYTLVCNLGSPNQKCKLGFGALEWKRNWKCRSFWDWFQHPNKKLFIGSATHEKLILFAVFKK